MTMVIRSKVVKIGNSRGLRIPRTLLEQAGLKDEVEMTVQDNQLVIRPARAVRQGWDVQFTQMAQENADRLLDSPRPTAWDEEEWEW